jgi:hypothetical protein
MIGEYSSLTSFIKQYINLVGELVSSWHQVAPIKMHFDQLKARYEELFGETLRFRLVITSFAWSIMRAAVESLNTQTMLEYAKIVFDIAHQPEHMSNYTHVSWFISCAASTMHVCIVMRFIGKVKFYFKISFQNNQVPISFLFENITKK